jgi:hypothetical protein
MWTGAGVVAVLVGGLLVAGVAKADYNAELCQAFAYNMDGTFDVPAGGEWRKVIDCSHCGGFVQNYQITLMTARRTHPVASIKCYDQTGKQVGATTVGWLVSIGTVPDGAIYTVVVTSGGKKERCQIYCSGGI